MNRENKRKQFQNGYYKNHRCDDTFTCKHCGRVVVPIGAGTQHRRSRWSALRKGPPLCHAFYATSRLQIPTMWYTERKTLGGFHP